MPKVNPSILKRPVSESLRYAFTDDNAPGQEWAMWFRKLDPLEFEFATQLAEDYVRKYILGGWLDENRGFQKDPCPVDAVDGKPITLSRKAFILTAKMEVAQSDRGADEIYTAIDILRTAPVMPDAWDKHRGVWYLLEDGQDPKKIWTAFMEPPSESDSEQGSDTPP